MTVAPGMKPLPPHESLTLSRKGRLKIALHFQWPAAAIMLTCAVGTAETNRKMILDRAT